VILKLVHHLSIDILWKRALPELVFLDLDCSGNETYRERDDWRYRALDPLYFRPAETLPVGWEGLPGLAWNLREHLGLERPELFIVDSQWELLIARVLRAKSIVWYAHGDFRDNGNPFHEFLRYCFEDLGDAPTLYASRERQVRNEEWRKPRKSCLVFQGVPEECFVPTPDETTDDVLWARNHVYHRLSLDGKGAQRRQIQELGHHYRGRAHLAGYNDPSDFLRDWTLRGRVAPWDPFAGFGCQVELCRNHSPNCAPHELLAAGLPLVTWPQEGWSDAPVIQARTTEEFRRGIETTLAERRDRGDAGREWVRKHRHSDLWGEIVREFIQKL